MKLRNILILDIKRCQDSTLTIIIIGLPTNGRHEDVSLV